MEVLVILGSNAGDGGDDAENVALEGKPGCWDRAGAREADEMGDGSCLGGDEGRPVLKRLDRPALDAAGEPNLTGPGGGGDPPGRCRSRSYEGDEHDPLQYVTTNEVRKEPALPQATRIGQRPGVVLVPTFHVQETRPLLGRFG